MDDKLNNDQDNQPTANSTESSSPNSEQPGEKTLNSESLAISSTESNAQITEEVSSQKADSVLKNQDSVLASKSVAIPKTEKELVLEALDDAFTYYNWCYSDKERLRYATVNTNRKQTKFYERFLFEGNLVFNLAVKLSARRKRLAK